MILGGGLVKGFVEEIVSTYDGLLLGDSCSIFVVV